MTAEMTSEWPGKSRHAIAIHYKNFYIDYRLYISVYSGYIFLRRFKHVPSQPEKCLVGRPRKWALAITTTSRLVPLESLSLELEVQPTKLPEEF